MPENKTASRNGEDDLDEFDLLIEGQQMEPRKERRSNVAIRDMVVNPEMAAQLVRGRSITAVALDLGVQPATIRKWMQTAPMQDLLAIEARRALRHMSRRDLSKEKYLGLATAVSTLLEREERMRNASVEPKDRLINQTVIDQINVLVYGRGNEGKSEKNVSDVSELGPEEVPEIPEDAEIK